MRITLNELRNLVRNILKENIEYPEVDFSDEGEAYRAWINTFVKLKEHLKSNLKVYNNDIEGYNNNFKIITLNLDRFEPRKSEQLRFDFIIDSITTGTRFLSRITTQNGKLVFSEAALYRGDKDSGEPFFESKKDVDLILDMYKNVAEKFMSTKLDTEALRTEWRDSIPDKSLFKVGSQSKEPSMKSTRDIAGSEDFRKSVRGGSYGSPKDFKMDYKSAFDKTSASKTSASKTYSNYNEWIGNESAENQKAITVLYRMVEKGRMDEDEFNSEIQELLNSPLNEIRKLVKNILKGR